MASEVARLGQIHGRSSRGIFRSRSQVAFLQTNLLDRRRWRTRAGLEYAIIEWIEHTYNRRRRQRALGKLTPVEFELAFTNTAHAA